MFSLLRSRTDTPVDKMMSSGGAQNLRPASAPGEDAPSVGSTDRNEVNITQLLLFNLLDLLYAMYYCTSALFCYVPAFPSWVLPTLKVYIYLCQFWSVVFWESESSSCCNCKLQPSDCQGWYGCWQWCIGWLHSIQALLAIVLICLWCSVGLFSSCSTTSLVP